MSSMKKLFILSFVLCSCIAASAENWNQYDANHDGSVDVADITAVANYILNGPSTPADTHDYVDLGLKSGLKWASCNVGASLPEEYGGHYSWGELAERDEYTWATYTWCNGTNNSLTKYNYDSNYGIVDSKNVLELEDDVANKEWGGDWRMPTDDDWTELSNSCKWTWTTMNDVPGYLVESRTNSNSIFLPAAGYHRKKDRFLSEKTYGFYWTSTISSSFPDNARCRSLNATNIGTVDYYRYYALSVRPVCQSNTGSSHEYNQYDTNKDGSVDVADITSVASYILKGPENIHYYVDLGLSVKWATCNVGALNPEEYGGYYAWGEKEEKDNYDWTTYSLCNGDYMHLTKYCTDSNFGTVDEKVELEAEDDVARALWGEDWRMPTAEEFEALVYGCDWTPETLNGVDGCRVTSRTNGNSIFLPTAGRYEKNEKKGAGSYGYYWTSTSYEDFSYNAFYIQFTSNSKKSNYIRRDYGMAIRPVYAPKK